MATYVHDEGTVQAAALALSRATGKEACRHGAFCTNGTTTHRATFLHPCKEGPNCADDSEAHRSLTYHAALVAPPTHQSRQHPTRQRPPALSGPKKDDVDDSDDDAPLDATATHRDVVSDAADVDTLLEAHAKSRRVRHAYKRAAGVLPVSIDPDTKRCWMLLGLSVGRKKNPAPVLCHFHGFTDPGETSAVGAAREGWEESKGCFGKRSQLWRAIVASSLQRAGDPVFAMPLMNRHCYLIRLADMTAEERACMQAAFAAAPAYTPCMAEVESLHWVATDELAVACRRCGGNTRLSSDIAVTGMPHGATLRAFVGKWFTTPEGIAQWDRPEVRALMEAGDPAPLRLLPMSQLPPTPADMDPQRYLGFLAAIGIPVCDRCGDEGHLAEQCQM